MSKKRRNKVKTIIGVAVAAVLIVVLVAGGAWLWRNDPLGLGSSNGGGTGNYVEYRDKYTELTGQYNALQTQLSILQSQLETKQGQLVTAGEDKQIILEQIAELNTQITGLNGQITTLLGQVQHYRDLANSGAIPAPEVIGSLSLHLRTEVVNGVNQVRRLGNLIFVDIDFRIDSPSFAQSIGFLPTGIAPSENVHGAVVSTAGRIAYVRVNTFGTIAFPGSFPGVADAAAYWQLRMIFEI